MKYLLVFIFFSSFSFAKTQVISTQYLQFEKANHAKQDNDKFNYFFLNIAQSDDEYFAEIVNENDSVLAKQKVNISDQRFFEMDFKSILENANLNIDTNEVSLKDIYIRFLLDLNKQTEEPIAGFLKMKKNDSLTIYRGLNFKEKIVNIKIGETTSERNDDTKTIFKEKRINLSHNTSSLSEYINASYNLIEINKKIDSLNFSLDSLKSISIESNINKFKTLVDSFEKASTTKLRNDIESLSNLLTQTQGTIISLSNDSVLENQDSSKLDSIAQDFDKINVKLNELKTISYKTIYLSRLNPILLKLEINFNNIEQHFSNLLSKANELNKLKKLDKAVNQNDSFSLDGYESKVLKIINNNDVHSTHYDNLFILKKRRRVNDFFRELHLNQNEEIRIIKNKLKHKKSIKNKIGAKKLYAIVFNNTIVDDGLNYKFYYKPRKNIAPEKYNKPGKLKDIQLEFEDGYLNKVLVTVYIDGKKHLFFNVLPIPFSSIRDIKKLDLIYLYNKDFASKDRINAFAVKLSEVITYYKPKLTNGRKDYSPDNITYEFEPSNEVRTITKNATKELFSARSYTDLFGVAEENPNGLVQLEISRRFNLYNNRYPLVPSLKGLANFGQLQYFDVEATLSKIETNNRNLDIKTFVPETGNTQQQLSRVKNYVNPIDLLRHEFFSFKTDLNVMHFDMPELKLEIDFNFVYKIGLSAIEDSVREIQNNQLIATKATARSSILQNTIMPYMKISSQLDERFGIDFKYGLGYMFMSDENIDFTSSYRRYEESKGEYRSRAKDLSYGFFGINLWFDPGAAKVKRNERPLNSGQFFFRFMLNYSFIERSQKFYQAQLGYSFNISKYNSLQKK